MSTFAPCMRTQALHWLLRQVTDLERHDPSDQAGSMPMGRPHGLGAGAPPVPPLDDDDVKGTIDTMMTSHIKDFRKLLLKT